MIFVTVGTGRGFDRLVREMDRIATSVGEKVIMQIGLSDYKPVNAEYFEFGSTEKMAEFYQGARIVICHGGVGTIIKALKYGKTVVVVPRMKEYMEIPDDHQVELARELERGGRVWTVYGISQLQKVLMTVNIPAVAVSEGNKRLVYALRDYINQLEGQRKER